MPEVSIDRNQLEQVATNLEKVSTNVDGEKGNGAGAVVGLIDEARESTDKEKKMGLRASFRAYPKACMWSLIFSTAIVMEGFDFSMVFSFYGLPAFQRRFGVPNPDEAGEYLITPAWQAGISNAVQIGSIIGLIICGWLSDRLGYVRTITVALVFIICFIFITFFAVSLPMLLIGEMLCGIPWGVFQTLTVSYATELAPITLRPVLTTYVNLCWVMGQFISAGVLKGVSKMNPNNQWAYRIPFALQWIWPLPILVCSLFAPESPWHLVRHGRLDKAKHSLQRVSGKSEQEIDIDNKIAQMVLTNELEVANRAGQSWLDIFRGINLRRTEIGAMVWLLQVTCGAGLIGQAVVFLRSAGLSADQAFSFNLGMYALGAVGTISSWFTMQYFGRRTLYIFGLAAMGLFALGLGLCSISSSSSADNAAGGLLVVFSFFYQFTVGPVCYCLVGELPATRLRAKSVAFSRIVYNIGSIINNILLPRMLSQLDWNWNKKTGFFVLGLNVLNIIYCYFRLPETKGRSFAEINILFEQHVSARKFKSTRVDLFEAARDHTGDIMNDDDAARKAEKARKQPAWEPPMGH